MKTFTRRKDPAAAATTNGGSIIINPHKNINDDKQSQVFNRQSIILVLPSQSKNNKKKKKTKNEEEEENGKVMKEEKEAEEEGTKKKRRKKEEVVDVEEGAGKGGAVAGSGFRMNRIDRIVRSEGTEYRITSEAIFLIKNATEKFLDAFCVESYASAIQDRKKSLGYKHLSTVVSKEKRLDFLSDFVPQKVKAEKALSEMKSSGTSPG